MNKAFVEKVDRFACRHGMLEDCDGIVVGLSGGADSVCLINVLDILKGRYGYDIYAVHVNHCIRGEEALRDEKFCKELCNKLGIQFKSVRRDVHDFAKKSGLTDEEAGRKVRYEEFGKVADMLADDGKVIKIATAHNLNDNAETVLFNMFRGSRLSGMAGIRAVNDRIIRPLLCAGRDEIEFFLEEMGSCYCIDSTNLTDDYTRNIIRHKILPVACQVNSDAIRHVGEAAEFSLAAVRFIDSFGQKVYGELVRNEGKAFVINREELLEQDPVIRKWIIRRMIGGMAGSLKDIESIHVDICMDLLESGTGKKVNLPYNIIAENEYDVFKIYTNKRQVIPDININVSEIIQGNVNGREYEICVPQGAYKFLIIDKIDSNIWKNDYTKWFDYDKIKNDVSLRYRSAGDYIIINHDGRRKKLKDFFIDNKIPVEKRNSLVMLAAGSEILYIPGYRGSEAYHVTDETKKVLKVTFEPCNTEEGHI